MKRHAHFWLRSHNAVLLLPALMLLALLWPAGAVEAQMRRLIKAEAALSQPQAHPGDQRALAVVIDIDKGFHLNGPVAGTGDAEFLIPTKVEVTQKPQWLLVGRPQFPATHALSVKYASKPLEVYEGRIVVYLPLAVDAAAPPGLGEVKVRVSYQACDDSVCYPPNSEEVTATLEVVGVDAAVAPGDPTNAELFTQFDASAFGDVGAAASGATLLQNDFLGLRFDIDGSTAAGVALVLLVALVAGFLLNFTPCVLPVIPIKVLSLHHQAKDPTQTLRLGLIFGLGIVATFAALGALVAGLVGGAARLLADSDRIDWGQLFSNPIVSVALAAVLIVMALGMFDLYAFRLPQKVYMFNPSHDTATGNFLLGVLTAVLSTPCSGPLLGGVIAWSVRQSPALSLGTFMTMGLGMALPYVVLTMNPKWIDHLPRAGPGSLLVKQAMGLLLLAVAVFFLGPLIPGAMEWWLIALLVVGAMAWVVVRTFTITPRMGVRLGVLLPAALMAVGSVAVAQMLNDEGPIPWRDYSHEAFDKARQENRTVLVEFTADWCGNCKFLEITTYRDKRLAAFFDAPEYVAFKVDLTRSDSPYWPKANELGGGGGIPLAAIYHPGREAPTAIFQGIFRPEQLIEALGKTDPQSASTISRK